MNKKLITAIIIGGMLSVCGCGNKIPELTEEQSSLVATYASDLIVQYSPEHDTGLIDIEEEAKRRAEVAEKAAKVQAIVDAQKAVEEQERLEAEEKLNNTETHDATKQEVVKGTMEDMKQFLGLENITLSYQGYEIATSYPSEDAEEWTPTIDATTGKNLLVVKLGVQNESSEIVKADVLSKAAQFRIKSKEAEGTHMGTMLLNDFSYMAEEKYTQVKQI